MSLEKKLFKLSSEFIKNKEEENKKLQEEELKPIRLKTEELKKTKFQLELILCSLNLKSEEKSPGIGMREYSVKTENKLKEENVLLDQLINKNQEVLKTIGIEKKDHLLENPDFAEDEEIINYKKSKAQKEELKLSDSALKEKLLSFGIIIEQEDFSYDLAEKNLKEKIEQVDKELALEKAKTPEGKKELKEELTQYLFEQMPSLSFSSSGEKYLNDRSYDLDLGKSDRIKFFTNTNFSIKKDDLNFDFIENWKKLEEKYPYDVIREAMKEVFKKKANNASYSYDITQSHSRERETEELKKFKKEVQPIILSKMENIIENKLRKKELIYKAKIQGLRGISDIKSVESFIKNLESDKEDALIALYRIKEIETKLPNEELILNGNHIEIHSLLKKYEEFRKETDEKLKRLEDVLREIRQLEIKKPKIFGIKKWKSNLDELTKEKEKLEERTNEKWHRKEDSRLWKEANILIPTKEYSMIEKIIENQPKIQGYPKEIFNSLKEKLNDVANKEVPKSIIELYNDFKDLREKD